MTISFRSLFKASLLTTTCGLIFSLQSAHAHDHGHWHHNGGYVAVNTGHPWHHHHHDHHYYGGGVPYYYGNPYPYGYYSGYDYPTYNYPEPSFNLNLNFGN